MARRVERRHVGATLQTEEHLLLEDDPLGETASTQLRLGLDRHGSVRPHIHGLVDLAVAAAADESLRERTETVRRSQTTIW